MLRNKQILAPYGRSGILLLCCLLFGLIPGTIQAQTTLTGKISDAETGEGIAGATLQVIGTTTGAFSNDDGSFRLEVPEVESPVLQVRYYGYTTQEINISGLTTLEIALEAEVNTLGEVVLIGYGTQKKEDLTGSIVSVSADDFVQGNINTPEQLINGKVPGVQITQNGGAPGAGSRIRIRGGSSLNASNDPLIVIDGVPVDNATIDGAANPLSLINPNDIETFTVLKDASATAIYGSRASNGVIIITTRQGAAGQPLRVNFSSTFSRADRTGEIQTLNRDQFITAVDSFGTPGRSDLIGDASTDWQSVIYRAAYSQDNNLSVSGAVGTMPYRVSVGFLNQNGILKGSNMQRASGSLSLTPSLWDDHLRIQVNLKGAQVSNQFADQGAIGTALRFDPTQPVQPDSGAFNGYFEWIDPGSGNPNTLAPKNPLGLLETRMDESTVLRSIGNVALDYRFHFLPELRTNLNLGYDISESNGTTFVPQEAASQFVRGGQDKTYSQSRENTTLEFYLNYVKAFEAADQRLDIMGGYSYQDFIRSNQELDLNLASPPDTFAAPPLYTTQNTLVSFYGRVNYSLANKYLLTVTLRQDGSSRFSPETRWGLFPSAAFAWKLSNEPVIAATPWISDLKLRLGYGVTGQQDVLSDYPYLARYTPSQDNAQYQFGSTFYQTLRPEGYDSGIKWEETTTYNVGIDYGFANDRFTGTVDVYLKQTRDLLSVIPVPAGSNFTNQILTNVGNIDNRGVELTFNAGVIEREDLQLDLGANFTFNQNTITNLTQVEDSSFQGILVGGIAGGVGNTIQIHSVDFPAFSYFVFEQNYDDEGRPIEGDYVDQNGDEMITPDDRVRKHSPNPQYFLGLTGQLRYKAFTASFLFRSNIGAYVYNNVNSNNGAYRAVQNAQPFLENMVVDVLNTSFENNQYFSDYYLEKASFIRFDNFSLGYDFGTIGNRLGLSVAAIGQNLAVWTTYSGLDPEVANGIDNNVYPVPRTISLRLNLTY